MKAVEIMTPVKPLALSELEKEKVLSYQLEFIPVVDAHGQYIGSIDVNCFFQMESAGRCCRFDETGDRCNHYF